MPISEVIDILIILCPLLFVAGFIDSIAGGGGIIALPAYMATGMPMHQIYGCGKLQCTIGTLGSMARFQKNKVVDNKTAIISAIFAVIAGAIGTRIIILLPDDFLSKAMTIIIPAVSFTMIINPKDDEAVYTAPDGAKTIILSAVAGFLIGLYDSLIGPGGGTLGMMFLIKIFKYDYKTSTANIKVILFASTFASLWGYVFSNNIIYAVAIPAAFFNMLGNYVGAGVAIKHGRKIIKPLAYAVVVVILIKYVVWPMIF